MIRIDRGHAFFDEIVSTRILRDGDDLEALSTKIEDLRIRVLKGTRRRRNQDVLRIECTNELDPYFLYFMEIAEDDFHALKSDQSLRVNFLQFPGKFVELLRRCCAPVEAPAGPAGLVEPEAVGNKDTVDHAATTPTPGADGGDLAFGRTGEFKASSSSADLVDTSTIVLERRRAVLSPPTTPSRRTPSSVPSSRTALSDFEVVLRLPRRSTIGSATPSLSTTTTSAHGDDDNDDDDALNATNSSYLDIVEANVFKNLTHLSLRVRPGNDADVKSYLAGRLQLERARTAELDRNLRSTERSLAEKVAECDELNAETNRLERSKRQEAERFAVRESATVNRITEESLARAERIQQEHTRALRELREENSRSLKESQSDAETCRSEAKAWREKSYELQSQLKSTEARLDISTKELASVRETCTTLRNDLGKSQRTQLDVERSLQKERVANAKLEESLKNNQQRIAEAVERVEACELQRERDEERVRNANECTRKLQEQLEKTASEIRKGNGIIARLNAERKESRATQKMNAKVLREQEKRIRSSGASLSSLKTELEDTQRAFKASKETLASKETERGDLLKQLDESRHVLDENQKVITWLNRQLNDAKMERDVESIGMRSAVSAYSFVEMGAADGNNGDIGGGEGTTTKTTTSSTSSIRQRRRHAGIGTNPLLPLTLRQTTTATQNRHHHPPFTSSGASKLSTFDTPNASAISSSSSSSSSILSPLPTIRERDANIIMSTSSPLSIYDRSVGVGSGTETRRVLSSSSTPATTTSFSASSSPFADSLRMGSVVMCGGGRNDDAKRSSATGTATPQDSKIAPPRRMTSLVQDENDYDFANDSLDTIGLMSAKKKYADLPTDHFGRLAAAALAATEGLEAHYGAPIDDSV
eukprot:g5082.t1